LTLQAGNAERVTFTRTSDVTCGTEITIPSLNIKHALPLNQPVDIDSTPHRPGDIAFVCGLGMLHGTIVVQELRPSHGNSPSSTWTAST
jgi:plastocyanin domain-containing protein